MSSDRPGSRNRPPAAAGDIYGRLTLVEFLDKRANRKGGMVQWVLAECSCPDRTRTELRLTSLRSGNTKSCGCLAREKTIERATRHGGHKTRLYGIWGSMKHRCTSPNTRSAHRYAGRGIAVCEAWQDFEPFRDWALANGYVDGKEIDRIDNNLGYDPDNCRWVTKLENLDNRAKYLPEQLEAWLHVHALGAGCSPYEVIKQALESYLGVSRVGSDRPSSEGQIEGTGFA